MKLIRKLLLTVFTVALFLGICAINPQEAKAGSSLSGGTYKISELGDANYAFEGDVIIDVDADVTWEYHSLDATGHKMTLTGDHALTFITDDVSLRADDLVIDGPEIVINEGEYGFSGYALQAKDTFTAKNASITINTSGNADCGIYADSMVFENTQLTISGPDEGIYSDGTAALNNCKLDMKAQADAIAAKNGISLTGCELQVDSKCGLYSNNGFIQIDHCTGSLKTYESCVYPDRYTVIKNANLTMESEDSKAINGLSDAVITDSTLKLNARDIAIFAVDDLTITGSDISAVSSIGYGLCAFGDLTVKQTALAIDSEEEAIYSDGNMWLEDVSGTLTSKQYGGIVSWGDLTISGSDLDLTTEASVPVLEAKGAITIADNNYVKSPAATKIGNIGVNALLNADGTPVLRKAVIAKKRVSDDLCTISPIADQEYTGSAITPAVTVAWNGTTLKKDTDYTLSYSNHTAIGKATVTVTGKGNYAGTAAKTFNIIHTKHVSDGGKVTKAPTVSSKGTRTYTCTICGEVLKTESIPKLKKEAALDPEVAPAVATAQKAIAAITGNGDPKDSKFCLLQTKAKKIDQKSVTLGWTRVDGASKYIIYGNQCKKGNPYKKIATVKGTQTSKKITKAAGKKLKKGTYYKFIVVAVAPDSAGVDKAIATSKSVHFMTKGNKKYGDYTKVTVKGGKSITLKKGKSKVLKATQVREKGKKVKEHRGLKYESDNKTIVSVNKKGKITAKKKGTATIYIYAQNGVFTKVKVTVK